MSKQVIKHPIFNANSVFLKSTFKLDSDEDIMNLTERIFKQIEFPIIDRKNYKLQRYKNALQLILMNLYANYKADTIMKYGRSRERYVSYYTNIKDNYYSYKYIIYIMDFLQQMNYIYNHLGYRWLPGVPGKLTRVQILPKLITIFDSYDTLIFEIDNNKLAQNVKLKNQDKQLVDYSRLLKKSSRDYPRSIVFNMKKSLQKINRFNEAQKITYLIPLEELIKEIIKKPRYEQILIYNIITNNIQINNIYTTNNINNNTKPNNKINSNIINNLMQYKCKLLELLQFFPVGNTKYTLELTLNNKYLYRVFNNNFRQGGRFYTPTFQTLPKFFRKYIHINGNKTVELDYSGIHIRLLYNKYISTNCIGDPYDITGNNDDRKCFKKISLITINAQTEETAIFAICDQLYQDYGYTLEYSDAKKGINMFKDKHPKISQYFHTGEGVRLQYHDSQIMENILTKLTSKKICGLPIHDSVIVEEQYKNDLYDIMMDSYYKYTNFYPIVG